MSVQENEQQLHRELDWLVLSKGRQFNEPK